MPPKRKQAANENGGSKSKNQKSEAAEEEQKQVEVEINTKPTVDPFCTTKLGKVRVFTEDGVDWEAMLLTPDNKHFYLLQLLEDLDYDPKSSKFSMKSHFVWTRWGKVGGKSQSKLHNLFMVHAAQACFEERFFEKTENDWNDKINFEPSGKYNLTKMNFNIGKPLVEVVVPKVSDDVENTQLSNASKENGENESKRQKKTKADETITKRQQTKNKEEEADEVKATTAVVTETRSKRQPTKVKDEEEVGELKTTAKVDETRSNRQQTKVKDEEEIVL